MTAMQPVAVLILLPPRSAAAETPTGWLEAAREITADHHCALFTAQGAADVRIVRETPDGRPFGRRLRDLVSGVVASRPSRRAGGLIILGGGAMPLAGPDDLAPFIATAVGRGRRALANSFYSADAVAVSDARMLLDLPDLPSDNALPRWLAERAGVPVADLRDRPGMVLDLDSPLDVLVIAAESTCPPPLVELATVIGAASPAVIRARDGVAAVLGSPRAELVVAGRSSARTMAWLERNAACRIRAFVEERGLRASSPMALGDVDAARHRPPRSLLGLLLDDRGPDALGDILGELGDAAVVDSRVLLAHRLGVDESSWPPLADRLASDLLRPEEIGDPWLRRLTEAAVRAPIPVLLGGHTLVGPGLPSLAARSERSAT
jgi:CTP:molybdopterin cytidylyltransferase MocA